MTVSSDYLAYVLEQLAGLGGVSSRRMFGGAGLYCDEFFFGLIADDVLYPDCESDNRCRTCREVGRPRGQPGGIPARCYERLRTRAEAARADGR